MEVEINRLTKSFNRRAFCEVYENKCGLEGETAKDFLRESFKIQMMNIPGLTWFPTFHLISVYPNIPLLIHLEAMDAAFNQSFEGIDRFYRRMIRNGYLPPWTLNQTRFYSLPNPELTIGRLMCELGLISENTRKRCLGIQKLIQHKGIKPALATIIASVESVSMPDLFHALAIQCQLPFDSLDASAATIFEATGKRISEGLQV